MAVCRPGDIVLIDRDCHKSHHYGFVLAGAQPYYVEAFPLTQYSMYGAVPLKTIKKALLDCQAQGVLDRKIGEAIAKAAADQVGTLAYASNWGSAHTPAIEAATLLAELAPGDRPRERAAGVTVPPPRVTRSIVSVPLTARATRAARRRKDRSRAGRSRARAARAPGRR